MGWYIVKWNYLSELVPDSPKTIFLASVGPTTLGLLFQPGGVEHWDFTPRLPDYNI